MQLIKADHDRRLEIPGVPGLARRPVDIDQSRTGFANLRSFRIYRFDAGSVINGHAEDDEVFVVVVEGTVDLTVSGGDAGDASLHFTLSAASDSGTDACAAYLPPHASYQLIPRSPADVLYVRAAATSGRPPAAFIPVRPGDRSGVTVLLEETTYAGRLDLRLLRIDGLRNDVDVCAVNESADNCETLVHLRTVPEAGAAAMVAAGVPPVALESWDTCAVVPGERPLLRVAQGGSVLAVIATATLARRSP